MSKQDLEKYILQEIVARDNEFGFNPPIFPEQKRFIEDPSKFKALLTSRRAGKSTVAIIYLLQEALKFPESQALYVGLTRKSAKTLVWRELKNFNKKYNLSAKFHGTDLVCELPNGSQIFLVGGNDEEAIEAVRGTIKPRVIIIDESASYRAHLKYLIDEVLTPMLIDCDGTLVLLGTPAAACAGPFFDATTGRDPSYSVHKWTLHSNPFIPHSKKWLADYKKAKGWADDNPIYLREWCGRWIKSDDSIVYKYDSTRNDLVTLPAGQWNYLIGVDIGYNDATAYVIGAYRKNDPKFYIVESYKRVNMTVDQIMDKLNVLIEEYKPDRIVMDSGGGGKLVAESFRKRYAIPIKPAQKKDKRDFIEQMNSDFVSGRIQVLPGMGNDQLRDEYRTVQWDEDHKREDERFICDLSDASLYVWRESVHYTEMALPPPIIPNTNDWYKKQVEEMEAHAQAEYDKRQEDELESQMHLDGAKDSGEW